MEVLLKIAHDAVTGNPAPPPLPQVVGAGAAAPPLPVPGGNPTQVAAVHALNILRALYRDSRLGDHVVPFIPEGVRVAITGFCAKEWPVSFRTVSFE